MIIFLSLKFHILPISIHITQMWFLKSYSMLHNSTRNIEESTNGDILQTISAPLISLSNIFFFKPKYVMRNDTLVLKSRGKYFLLCNCIRLLTKNCPPRQLIIDSTQYYGKEDYNCLTRNLHGLTLYCYLLPFSCL